MAANRTVAILFLSVLIASTSSWTTVYGAVVQVDDYASVNGGPPVYDHWTIKRAYNAAGPDGTIVFTGGRTYHIGWQLQPKPGQQFIGNGAILRRSDAPVTRLTQDVPAGATSVHVEDSSVLQTVNGITPVKGTGASWHGERYTKHYITSVSGNQVNFSTGLSQSYVANDLVTNEFHMVSANVNNLFDGFVFDGNRENNDVYVSWSKNKAIAGHDGLVVRNSIFQDLPGDAIGAYGTDILIENNVFRDSNTAAVHISGNYEDTDVIIQKNLFVRTNSQYWRAGHSEGMITVSHINNHVRVLDNYAMDAPVPFIGKFIRDMGDWTISGNQVVQTAGFLFGRGDQNYPPPEDTLYDILVDGNYAEDVGQSLLWGFQEHQLRGFQFTNNTIVDGSFLIQTLLDSIIEDNVFQTCTADPLRVENYINSSIADNQIVASHCDDPQEFGAQLIYNSRTGNVTLDASGMPHGRIDRFAIANRGTTELFRLDNLMLPFSDSGSNTSVQPFLIGQFDTVTSESASTSGANGTLDLGNILPPDMTSIEEVEEYLLLARFADSLGNYGNLDIQVIPEPTTIYLMELGLSVLLLNYRRRRFPTPH